MEATRQEHTMTSTATSIIDLATELGADPADIAATAHQLADSDGPDATYTGDTEPGPPVDFGVGVMSAGTVLTAEAATQIRDNWADAKPVDLTDATITAAFGDAATVDGNAVTIDLGITVDADDDADTIERTVLEELTSGRPVLMDHAMELTGEDTWDNPHLFLAQASIAVGDGGFIARGSAWAGYWDGEDFNNERSGRDVVIFVPFTFD